MKSMIREVVVDSQKLEMPFPDEFLEWGFHLPDRDE